LELERNGTDQVGGRNFPIYHRLWERFPSGRTYERLSMIRGDATEYSISKCVDSDGVREYAVRQGPVLARLDMLTEFLSEGRCGQAPCTRADFEALRAELAEYLAGTGPKGGPTGGT